MTNVKVPVVFVIGGPGSGKGTQCDKIVESYGFTHLSTGDLLREEVSSGSERGSRLSEIMTRGDLVPMQDMLMMLKDAISKNLLTSKGYLIDGFPREIEQAIAFEKEVSQCTMILFFDVPDDVMRDRLLERGKTSGRTDDNAETIVNRLATFHQYTQPILDHFGDKVKTVNAVGSIEEIFQSVKVILDTLL